MPATGGKNRGIQLQKDFGLLPKTKWVYPYQRTYYGISLYRRGGYTIGVHSMVSNIKMHPNACLVLVSIILLGGQSKSLN